MRTWLLCSLLLAVVMRLEAPSLTPRQQWTVTCNPVSPSSLSYFCHGVLLHQPAKPQHLPSARHWHGCLRSRWRIISIVLVLKRLRQEDCHGFEATLDSTVSSWVQTACLKITTTTTTKSNKRKQSPEKKQKPFVWW